MGFLGDLASQLGSDFSFGENNAKVLNQDGIRYGGLGDFASKFDQSAERVYLEEGYLRKDAFNTDSKQFEILMQEPSATVLVKKRMLSSLGDNFRTDYMDKQDRLYYKAMMILFQNKCAQIAALERLSKIEKITSSMNSVDEQVMTVILSLGSLLGSEDSNNTELNSFTSTVSRLRKIYAFNKPSQVTNWITNNIQVFKNQFGQGTGVIEVTNFTSLNTKVTNDIANQGTFTLNIADPYELMVVSEYDIEKALSDANNPFLSSSIFQTTKYDNQQLINDLTSRLNTYRRARGASEIIFNFNPDTLLGKRVTAIIEGIGLEIPFEFNGLSTSALLGGLDQGDNGVTVPKEYLFDGEIAGFEGLANSPKKFGGDAYFTNQEKIHQGEFTTKSELVIFQSLVAALYNKVSINNNSRSALFQNNSEFNYTRKKMRFNFLGKLIIQPMDTVNIYINTKSQFDNKLTGGLKNMFTGLNFIQSAANGISGVVGNFSTLFNPSSLSVAAEKSAFVGEEFPSWLWYFLRPQFVNEKEGTHVFAGIVNSSSGAWNAGSFSVAIGGTDNSSYLTMGKINWKPGVDNWSGKIYDPITPFKTSFDSVTTNYSEEIPTLLDENKILLGPAEGDESKRPLVKFKLGSYAGKSVNQLNYIQDRKVDPTSNRLTRTFYAPDGLAYRWKEGIGSFIQFGSSFDLNNPSNVGIPPITEDPFAGQDVMNVISLLVTGIPYNFNTYWKAVSNFENINNDPQSGQSGANSFYTALRNDLEKRNALWGNFIPFKNLVMDEESYKLARSGLVRILQTNSQLEKKLKELSDIEAQANMYGLNFIINELKAIEEDRSKSVVDKLKTKSNAKQEEINELITALNAEDKTFFTQVGDDISFYFDDFLNQDSRSAQSILVDPNSRRALRRKVNFLTRRMSYNVRANEDKNLLIVDDFYDKDYDIAAFNSALSNNFKLYNNDFLNPKEKITLAANLLNLEVFCDTQGHIRVRPPQYNRMPSSIFHKMMFQKRSLNIKIFPEFLNSLFETQLTTLRQKIEIVEDEIRLNCALLGFTEDFQSTDFLAKEGNQGIPFAFISDENTGLISDIESLKLQAIPNADENGLFKPIEDQATSTRDIFNSAARFSFIKERISEVANSTFNPSNPYNISDLVNYNENVWINELIERIESKSGQKVSRTDFLISNPQPFMVAGLPQKKYIDIFKVTKDLSSKLSERQKAIKLFYDALKNSAEFISLDEENKTANSLISSGQFYNNKVPEVFEHMVEDETYDDYGPGSGSRYIIKNSQIKQYTISENPPDYTYVEVEGTLNPYAPGGLPQGLNSFPQGGNGLVTAAAVDYDLWRSYGWKETSKQQVPFLSDPKSQCAPYAVSLLSRIRKNILRGSIIISGNEYMQPGEVVFIENRGLLFYVTEVTHNYNQGTSFTTTLTLNYGHPPGDYIPTVLDVIGKLIYNNRDIAGFEIQRQTSAFNEANYGCLIFDPNLNLEADDVETLAELSPTNNLGGETYGHINAAVLSNLAYTSSYMVYSASDEGINYIPKIELRIYYDSKTDVNPDLNKFATFAKDILTGNATMPANISALIGKSTKTFNVLSDKDIVTVLPVDLSSTNDHRSPSQKAWTAVRNLTDQNSAPISSTDEENIQELSSYEIKQNRKKLRETLYKYIVDCWVRLEPVPPKTK